MKTTVFIFKVEYFHLYLPIPRELFKNAKKKIYQRIAQKKVELVFKLLMKTDKNIIRMPRCI